MTGGTDVTQRLTAEIIRQGEDFYFGRWSAPLEVDRFR